MRKAATGTGLGLVAAYGYTRAKFRRTTSETIRVSEPPPAGSEDFVRLVEVVTGASVRPGNRVRILRNGAETFPAMLEAIASARETIDFSSYIYWPGDITEQFTEAFAQKARQGLEVNMILDGYGSAKLDRGSSNFDHRSFALDAELNVTLHDQTVAEELAAHFLDDLQYADEVDIGRWRSRPLATRASELAAELGRQSF